jgi:hypothetical protein
MLIVRILIRYWVVAGLALLVSGCELINPEEQIPSYITIDDITVNEDNSQVTDAWVYVDDYLVGSYDLPAHFPVLNSGEVDITVRPGIRVNGIAVTRGFYSFYNEWETTVNLTEGESTVLNPVTEYKSGLDFAWVEDFESVALSLEPYDTLNLNFTKTDTVSDAVTPKVGVVGIMPDSIFSVQTIDQFEMPSSGDIYLELSFKTDIPFELAWKVQNIETTVIRNNRLYQFLPTDEWQHIYIYLSTFTKEYNTDVNRFQFLLGAANIDDDIKYIYIDNIKLVHSYE